MERMRICQVCAVDITMDILLRQLNASLIEEGFEVIGVCSFGKATPRLIEEGFNIININIDRSIKPISNLKAIFEMYKLFRKCKPNIVHVHTPVAAVLGRIAAKAAGVPCIVYTAHGFYFHENMKPLAYKISFGIEKFMCKYFTDVIFTQSKEDAKTAIENNFKSKEKIIAIGNGVDVRNKYNPQKIDKDEIVKLEKELNINKEDRVITFIGRLVKEKGILDLLQAFVKLVNETEDSNGNGNNGDSHHYYSVDSHQQNHQLKNFKLIVVGDIFQGDRDKETINRIEEYKSHKNIIFTGNRNDVNNILFITDIFCLPSYREGMPRSIIEAMAMNCAVVATNIRGAREEVIDGHTGFLVELSNIDCLKDRIARLVNDKHLLENMKFYGRKRAEALYEEKKVVRLQIKILKNLLRSRRSL